MRETEMLVDALRREHPDHETHAGWRGRPLDYKSDDDEDDESVDDAAPQIVVPPPDASFDRVEVGWRKRFMPGIREIADRHGVTVADIFGKCRLPRIVAARHEAMWYVYQGRPIYCWIGRIFGRDHSTVMAAVRKIERKRAAGIFQEDASGGMVEMRGPLRAMHGENRGDAEVRSHSS